MSDQALLDAARAAARLADRIATNTSLDLIGRRRKRVLPRDLVPKPIRSGRRSEGIWLYRRASARP